MSKVLIVGGGAAGMMAAVFAARNGHNVTIYEKNEKLGKKLFITGKGRCNITNACDIETLFQNVVSNHKFLYSAFYGFDNYSVIEFFESLGLKTKIERGGRVFPESDHSSDVIAVLTKELKRLGVEIKYKETVQKILIQDNSIQGILVNNREIKSDAVIIATGGCSYPVTGSTGDGYRFAKEMNHTITKLSPSLVPFHIKEDVVKQLQGLSLKNVRVTVKAGKKEVFSDFGEMLFTHFGVSGPVILSASSFLVPYFEKGKEVSITIDLKPALSFEQLDNRILRDFDEFHNKQFANALNQLLPKKMIPVIVERSGIDPYKKVNIITKEERSQLVNAIKNMTLQVVGLRDYKEAIITKGGVKVNEINPATMESKLVKGVYYIGEVLDLDALTGGFNLQIAWSTAYVAGNAIE